MLKSVALLLCLLASGCAVSHPHQTKNVDAPPECSSHDDEIDCTWNDVHEVAQGRFQA